MPADEDAFVDSRAPEGSHTSANLPASEDSHTLRLNLSYRGTPFAGFARQPGRLTVQGSLEQALELLYKRRIATVCAGRTDAGVHALSQVVSFDLSREEFALRSVKALKRSLNALVDEHISISAACEVPVGFSARFDATAREYRYFIYEGDERPVLLEGFVWHLPSVASLDCEAMREAACYLVGEHDFKSFCTAASAEGKPTCRRIIEITIGQEEILGNRVLVVRVVGNAFLHSMVRTLVGTLVEIGRGKRVSAWVTEVLAACDRRAAGECAPARGLVLWRVFYEGFDKAL